MHPDTLLAWSMNGEYLLHIHGAPVRAIVPGWSGNWWVKWLERLEVLDHLPQCYYQHHYFVTANRQDPEGDDHVMGRCAARRRPLDKIALRVASTRFSGSRGAAGNDRAREVSVDAEECIRAFGRASERCCGARSYLWIEEPAFPHPRSCADETGRVSADSVDYQRKTSTGRPRSHDFVGARTYGPMHMSALTSPTPTRLSACSSDEQARKVVRAGRRSHESFREQALGGAAKWRSVAKPRSRASVGPDSARSVLKHALRGPDEALLIHDPRSRRRDEATALALAPPSCIWGRRSRATGRQAQRRRGVVGGGVGELLHVSGEFARKVEVRGGVDVSGACSPMVRKRWRRSSMRRTVSNELGAARKPNLRETMALRESLRCQKRRGSGLPHPDRTRVSLAGARAAFRAGQKRPVRNHRRPG